jgi:hypothetical protein
VVTMLLGLYFVSLYTDYRLVESIFLNNVGDYIASVIGYSQHQGYVLLSVVVLQHPLPVGVIR